ncbi:MAG: hypothetical protein ACOC95_00725 [Planctomycetota bacterium]
MRTQKDDTALKHLSNNRETFLALLEVSRNLPQERIDELITARDCEEIDRVVIHALMGRRC